MCIATKATDLLKLDWVERSITLPGCALLAGAVFTGRGPCREASQSWRSPDEKVFIGLRVDKDPTSNAFVLRGLCRLGSTSRVFRSCLCGGNEVEPPFTFVNGRQY